MALPHKRVKEAPQLIEKKRVAKLWHRFWFGGAMVPDGPDTFLLFFGPGEGRGNCEGQGSQRNS